VGDLDAMRDTKMELLVEIQPAKKTIEESNGPMVVENPRGPR